VNDVNIQKSIHSYTDTATIKIPATARLQTANTLQALPLLSQISVSSDTAKIFSQGDKVTIQLGYDGQLQTEFVGFIKAVGFSTPCQIDCVGYVWQLSHTQKFTKYWKSVSLKQVLQLIIAGTDIKLDPNISDFQLSSFKIDEKTGAEVLDLLKDQHVTTYFLGNMLCATIKDVYQTNDMVTYKLGWNTLEDDSLKFTGLQDVNVKVNVTYKDAVGKEHQVMKQYGTGLLSSQVTKSLRLTNVPDDATIDAKAESFALKNIFHGYKGRITAFLTPYSLHGWATNILDDKYPERQGKYLIESVEIEFGQKGARRIIELGKAL